MNKKNEGFTLVELMIVVAVLGILSAIAIPSYTQYIVESKRTEAKTELLRIAQLQESYYVQNLSYALRLNGSGGLGFSSNVLTTESGLYTVRVWGLDSNNRINRCNGTSARPCVGYRIDAYPVSGRGQGRDDACLRGFRYLNTGLKQARGQSDRNWEDRETARECWN